MSNGPIEKLHMVIVLQPDLDKAITFYKQLGLPLVFHLKDTWAEFKLGDSKFGLCPTSESQEGTRTGIVLQVADVKKTYEELKDEITFISEPKEAVHGMMASFKDPGGNILDLYQPTPEKVIELVKKVKDDDERAEDEAAVKKACCGQKGCCSSGQQETGMC